MVRRMQRTPTGPVGTAMISPTNMPFNRKPSSIRRPTLAKPAALSGKGRKGATEMVGSRRFAAVRRWASVAGDARAGDQAAGVFLPGLRPAGRQPLSPADRHRLGTAGPPLRDRTHDRGGRARRFGPDGALDHLRGSGWVGGGARVCGAARG